MGFSANALDWWTNPIPANRGSVSLDRASRDAIQDLAAIETILGAAEMTGAAIDQDLSAKLASLASRAGKCKQVKVPAKIISVPATPTIKEVVAPPPTKPTVVALNPKKWTDFPLEKRTDINHNTRRLRFKLPVEHLGLPVGMHIFLKGNVAGKPVMRAYTPVGYGPFYVEFIIKVYFPLPPRFPEGGVLTQHMESLKVGDTLSFKGPLGHFDFDCAPVPSVPRDALCSFTNEGKPAQYKHLGLIAGGSGITPCLQVATELLKLDRDVTVSLLYANQSPEDILCDEEIAAIEKDPRVKVWYTVDRAPPDWKYSVGFIDEAMCRERLPPPSEHTYIFMCGPPPMLKFACRPNLDKIGHAEERVLAF